VVVRRRTRAEGKLDQGAAMAPAAELGDGKALARVKMQRGALL
jgi:hypothetical protein